MTKNALTGDIFIGTSLGNTKLVRFFSLLPSAVPMAHRHQQ